jgi:DNA-binding transcriptional LysR family regulator
VKVTLVSSYTRRLKDLLARGEADVILTTEAACEEGGETLLRSPLIWVGAPGGTAWKARPLRLAFENNCIFRPPVQKALDAAGIPWEMAVTSDSTRTIEASVSADLAVHASIGMTVPPYFEAIRHGGALPELQVTLINMYVAEAVEGSPTGRVAAIVREAFLGCEMETAAERSAA